MEKLFMVSCLSRDGKGNSTGKVYQPVEESKIKFSGIEHTTISVLHPSQFKKGFKENRAYGYSNCPSIETFLIQAQNLDEVKEHPHIKGYIQSCANNKARFMNEGALINALDCWLIIKIYECELTPYNESNTSGFFFPSLPLETIEIGFNDWE